MEKTDLSINGHLIIKDKYTGEVLLDKNNAIHYENMSLAICYSLANNGDGVIYAMDFGNGGTSLSGVDEITYYPTNTTDTNADLYNQTYRKLIDSDTSFITVRHLQGTTYSDLVVTVTLDYNEPSDQDAFDDSTNINGDYVFDELGLKTPEGRLITHVIFNPIQKSLNRILEIVYTIRFQMS